jgi:hypothetical protein
MTDSPTPKRRGWMDALVATALRWNERLGRPVGEDSPEAGPAHHAPPHTPGRRLRSRTRRDPQTGPQRA